MAITIIKGSRSSAKSRELLLKYGCGDASRKRINKMENEDDTWEGDEESPLATTLSFLTNRSEMKLDQQKTALKVFEKVALRFLDIIEKEQNRSNQVQRDLAQVKAELASLQSEVDDHSIRKSAQDISDVSKKALATKSKTSKSTTKKSRSGAGK